MKNQSFLCIANWKMKYAHNQALSFARDNKAGFEQLAAAHSNKKIILCPSHDVLAQVADLFKGSAVVMGGQNCSAHALGNYTGEVAAESLEQMGCRFCIVGHSERRMFCAETNEDIARKIEHLIRLNITPIVCVGETKEEYDRHETLSAITVQLKAASKGIKKMSGHMYIGIAYEPVWAIGTGLVASNAHIEGVFKHIAELMCTEQSHCKFALLYGGSVDENTASQLAQIHGLHGFLIGGASLDFKKFEKIVTLRA